ncbi:MAG: YdiU family protein [Algicola sp.]|nr:YdiU family protein [Algicola sp.]
MNNSSIGSNEKYKNFSQIDGSHPLRTAIPKGYIDYQARIRSGGKVSYFNFNLAREIGLIPSDHPDELKQDLTSEIINTFSLQIINEFDIANGKVFANEDIKTGKYMATRYLQLQHDDDQGLKSGDGRSIWNGQLTHNNVTYDLSSCGTGGTQFSPATSRLGEYFETGDRSVTYGCGYCDIEEGINSILMSGIFHQLGISTERTLSIVEFDDIISINTRVHNNLLRPSHLFLYLRQSRLQELTSLADYYIERQQQNGKLPATFENESKYDYLLNLMAQQFARLIAYCDDHYIFCWLDWDGDNILMDGGFLDYGSVRYFGLYHTEYCYDDEDEPSPCILEQKENALKTIQVMAQAVDYIKTGTKRDIEAFAEHSSLTLFEQAFDRQKLENTLFKMGLPRGIFTPLIDQHAELISNFRESYKVFELAKTDQSTRKNQFDIPLQALFSTNNLLREYPELLLSSHNEPDNVKLLQILLVDDYRITDFSIKDSWLNALKAFRQHYHSLLELACAYSSNNKQDMLIEIRDRSKIVNKRDRITGTALRAIWDLVLREEERVGPDEFYQLMEAIVAYQNTDPDIAAPMPKQYPEKMFRKALEIFEAHRYGF